MAVGDKITIEVEEFDIASNPKEIMVKDSTNLVLAGKLKSYLALKKELEEEGVL